MRNQIGVFVLQQSFQKEHCAINAALDNAKLMEVKVEQVLYDTLNGGFIYLLQSDGRSGNVKVSVIRVSSETGLLAPPLAAKKFKALEITD